MKIYPTILFFSAVPAVYGSVDCLRSDYPYSSTQYPLSLHINLCTVFVIKVFDVLSPELKYSNSGAPFLYLLLII